MNKSLPDTIAVAPARDEDQRHDLPQGMCRLTYQVAAGNALHDDIAEKVCACWVNLHDAAGSYRDRLRALLHEAFSNALLHGCLDISGFSRNSADDLLRQEEEMRERMAERVYASRMITIELTAVGAATVIMVEDEGAGYAVQDFEKATDSELCLRGLQLIHKLGNRVAIENGGRRIVISVAAHP